MSRPEPAVWVLDPRRWTARHSVVAAISVVSLAAIALTGSGPSNETVKQLLAAAIGLSMITLALTLTGVEHGGLIIGLIVSGATMAHFSGHETLFEMISALGSVVYLIIARSPRHLFTVPRMGSAWMRTSFWLIGGLGAVVAFRFEVGFLRGLYATSNLVLAMAVVGLTRRSDRDLSVGVMAAFLMALGVLLIDGSANAFDPLHPLPPGNLGPPLQDRFWGGTHVAYGPNSMGILALLVAIRVAGDRSFQVWQRAAAVAVAVVVLPLTASRTVLIVAAGAAATYAWLYVRRAVGPGPLRKLSGVTAVVVVVIVLAAGGGITFFTRDSEDPTAGRFNTWETVLEEFRDAPISEKLLGNSDSTRATVIRDVPGVGRWPTPTDNAALGALRRAGVLGLAAFLVGLVLLIRRSITALRRVDLATTYWWFPIVALATLPTILSADWYLGTVGHLSTVLLIGEAGTLLKAPAGVPTAAQEAPIDAARRRIVLTIGALVSIGIVATHRAVVLAPPSLWRDDTWQALVAKADSASDVALLWSTAPGFTVVLKLLTATVGFSELRMQLVPFIAGVVAPPITYLVARRFGVSRWAAAVAGAVIAVAPMHAAYSTRVKPYTVEVLLTLLILDMGRRVTDAPDSRRAWLGFTVASVVASTISTPLALASGSALLASLFAWRSAPRRVSAPIPLASLGVFGLTAGALWLWIVRPASNPLLIRFWSSHLAPESADPGRWVSGLIITTGRLLDGLFPGPRPLRVLLGVVAIVGVWIGARRLGPRSLLLGLPVLAALTAWGLRRAPLGTGRTDLYLYPCIAIAIAFAIDALRGHARAIASVVAVYALVLVGLVRTDVAPYPSADTKPLVRIIDDRMGPRDVAFVYPQDGYAYGLYTRRDVSFEPDSTMGGFETVSADTRVLIASPHWDRPAGYRFAEIRRQLRGELKRLKDWIADRQPRRIWFLARHDNTRIADYEAVVRRAGYERVSSIGRPGASLTLWDRSASEDSDA